MEKLTEEASAWAQAHGLLMMAGDDLCAHAPMSLLPTKLSKNAFAEAKAMSCAFNSLVDGAARDLDWLYETLSSVLDHDEFTARLVQLCKEVEAEGVVQRAYLGVHRSDYMLHKGEKFLQVELNTIASSFGCLSARVAKMHRFLLRRFGLAMPFIAEFMAVKEVDIGEMLPENLADENIPLAIAEAAKYHAKEKKLEGIPMVVFVVQEGEKNSFDQRWLEYEMWEKHQVATVRKSLRQLHEEATLEGEERRLCIEGKCVSVVYFRAGYTPNDYPSEVEWEARKMVERSNAIKCPSVQYHLVGTKKVQQRLAGPGQVERFIGEEEGAKLRQCFAGLWTLSEKEHNDESRAAIQDAIENPHMYVIKPQREGGGNNIYGDKVKDTLLNMPKEEQGSYILMQRIFPQEVDACLVRRGKAEKVKALQELGVYATYLGTGDGEAVFNRHAGHLLRTKQVGVDEGGVATGYSCLDSPFLV